MPADDERRRVIFGWPRDRGDVLHGVLDDPTGVARERPWLRNTAPLCDPRRPPALMRVTPEHEFSPDGVSFVRGRVCGRCVPVWSALYAEPIPGFDRVCQRCGETRPVNEFRADRRTRDGVSGTCERCRQAGTIRAASF